MNVNQLQNIPTPVWIILGILGFILKGIALWRSAQSAQKIWFIVLVIISNDFGVLELIYLFGFAKEKLSFAEIKSWFNFISGK